VVNTPTTHIPDNWVLVSGGIGQFTPTNLGIMVAGPDIYTYVMSILQNPTLTSRVDPVDAACTSHDHCIGYLLTTGIKNIAPWPYLAMQASNSSFYIVKDVPSYQLDAWPVSSDATVSQWPDQDCSTYGVSDNTGTRYAFQVCATSSGQPNVIRAGKHLYRN